jgi:hypothetical protein
MQHMLKLFGLLILPTQGVSALAEFPNQAPLISSAALIWTQADRLAGREAILPLQLSNGFACQKPGAATFVSA